MAITEGEFQFVTLNAEAKLNHVFEVHPPRQEECHGIHTFDESEHLETDLVHVRILLGDDNLSEFIDITDRLTPEEKAKIIKQAE